MALRMATSMVALVSALALAGCATQGSGRAGGGTAWPMIGGDYANQRFAGQTQINRDTVARLGGAWTADLPANARATPVMVDGTLFVTAVSEVVAIDAATGARRWTYKSDAPIQGINKGVAVGGGKVFAGLADGRLLALDQKTGQKLWLQLVGDDLPDRPDLAGNPYQPRTGQLVTAAPAYIDGMVLASLAGGDYGVPGRVTAFDAATGKQLWHFNVIPGPGEFGHDTWPAGSDVWKSGGGAVWMNPVIDRAQGLLFFGIGNPVPQWGGEVRKGDNLFTDSVVALDLKTGKRRWHYQFVRHDIWEQDVGTPLVLIDAKVAGKMQKAVAIVRTDGWLFLLDRATGKPVWPVEERAVPQNPRLFTAPTQPFPIGAEQLGPNCAPVDMMAPGFKPGCFYDPIDVDQPNVLTRVKTARAAAPAYSPQTGYLYVTGGVLPFWIHRMEDPRFFGVGDAPGIKSYGLVAAFDVATNKIAWQKRVPLPVENGSGVLATAGGLVFHGEPDGTVQAYDAKTGETVWQFQTGAAVDGPLSSYEVGGRQHLAVIAGNKLWSFALDGKVAPGSPPLVPSPVSKIAGRIVATDQVSMAAPVADMGLNNVAEQMNEYAFKPLRIRVKEGAKVTFTNNGKETHEAIAMDGSWHSGPIAPGKSGTVTFTKKGTWVYQCKDHPWSYAEVTVE